MALACCVPGSESAICLLHKSRSLNDVSGALREILGRQTIKLIFGICFNRRQGRTVTENNFHFIDVHNKNKNNYEKVIGIVGTTLNNINGARQSIYVFGFGDALTNHTDLLKFITEPCNGVEEAISEYRRFAMAARSTERVSYGPIIRKATYMASQNRDQHHVLVIVASEPVTRSFDTKHGKLSPDEEDTHKAIKDAKMFRLSIILVGIGETNASMKNGLGNSDCCSHNNFTFVDYTQIMKNTPVIGRDKETDFCLAVIENLPGQIRQGIERPARANVTAAEVLPSIVYIPPLIDNLAQQ
ncbi:E3 ubiquitin-protein ligase RGLG1-like [Papaver somniferum]|uniref:E3 ubiquitin-protein ligase RGLG1-like n=1 Tax=Papaver somniferum TaxID=3469 RepID=UPI000E6FA8FB|nr:E3 ubiquitin-protein ligase RGLG1-like [Papaver somniferum]